MDPDVFPVYPLGVDPDVSLDPLPVFSSSGGSWWFPGSSSCLPVPGGGSWWFPGSSSCLHDFYSEFVFPFSKPLHLVHGLYPKLIPLLH